MLRCLIELDFDKQLQDDILEYCVGVIETLPSHSLDLHKFSILFDLVALRQSHDAKDKELFNRAFRIFLEIFDIADSSPEKQRYAFQVMYLADKFDLIETPLRERCEAIIERLKEQMAQHQKNVRQNIDFDSSEIH